MMYFYLQKVRYSQSHSCLGKMEENKSEKYSFHSMLLKQHVSTYLLSFRLRSFVIYTKVFCFTNVFIKGTTSSDIRHKVYRIHKMLLHGKFHFSSISIVLNAAELPNAAINFPDLSEC